VKIEIFDQTYNVNAESDEVYMRELAAYVDGKMRAVAEATKLVDSVKIAVLAALNMADELFVVRQEREDWKGPVRERVERCAQIVDRVLDNPAA
jgi:cell division protein ZapA